MTSTTEMVSPGLGHQHTSCLGDVNCDARHDYGIGINLARGLNLYQTGSYEIKCDEHFIGCDSDINPTSSEPFDAGNMSSITACTYTKNVDVTEHFEKFCDINFAHLISTCTYELHLHFGEDNSNECQLFEVWVAVKLSHDSPSRTYGQLSRRHICLGW